MLPLGMRFRVQALTYLVGRILKAELCTSGIACN